MTDSQTLLAEFVKSGSEAAFRELVERYLDLVHSTAVRLLGGNMAMAEDVAQTVFVDLARRAKSLSSEVRLGGWLHRHACFVAANMLRGERRRQFREKQAVEMNAQPDHSEARLAEVAPMLDEAINQLGTTDRAAVLLRFYERLDFRAVGEALGTNEAAAQKRVARALEKLHALLKRRGVTMSALALGAALSGEAVTAAPAGLVAGISGTAVAKAAAGTGNTLTLIQIMTETKLKSALVAAVIAACVVMPLLVQHQAQATLNRQDETGQRQAWQLAQMTAENQRLANLLAQTKSTLPGQDNQFRELLRLRAEVGRLKNNVQEATSAKATTPLSPEDKLASLKTFYARQVARLKQWMDANPSEMIPELRNMSDEDWLNVVENLDSDNDFARAARMLRAHGEEGVLGTLGGALRKYAANNSGQFPTELAQLKPYFKSPIDDAVLQRYAILPARSLVPELQPGGDWVITQAAPVNPAVDLREAVGLKEMRMADERVTNRWTLVR